VVFGTECRGSFWRVMSGAGNLAKSGLSKQQRVFKSTWKQRNSTEKADQQRSTFLKAQVVRNGSPRYHPGRQSDGGLQAILFARLNNPRASKVHLHRWASWERQGWSCTRYLRRRSRTCLPKSRRLPACSGCNRL
jgi:hypothetical protein